MSQALEDFKGELRDLFVGDRTIGDSFPAPIAFVAVNVFAGIEAAAVAAVIVGGLVAAWRIRNGQQVVYALGGIAAIGFASLLALRSGRAESYFLPGIVGAFSAGVAAAVSVVVRRPMAAYSSWFLRRWPLPWYFRSDVRPAYTTVTLVWAVFFFARGGVQWLLFTQGRPEALAVAKLATSWPLIIPLLVGTYLWGNHKLHALGGPSVEEYLTGKEAPFAGGQRGF